MDPRIFEEMLVAISKLEKNSQSAGLLQGSSIPLQMVTRIPPKIYPLVPGVMLLTNRPTNVAENISSLAVLNIPKKAWDAALCIIALLLDSLLVCV